jgi:hypothetical protein
MKQKLIDILERFCPHNVFLQGTMNPDAAYPAEFVTFWTPSTAAHAHYNNAADSVDWLFYVVYYSNDPAQVNSKPFEIAAALKAAGFVQQGRGSDILSDEPTHTGWAMDFAYTEKL